MMSLIIKGLSRMAKTRMVLVCAPWPVTVALCDGSKTLGDNG